MVGGQSQSQCRYVRDLLWSEFVNELGNYDDEINCFLAMPRQVFS